MTARVKPIGKVRGTATGSITFREGTIILGTVPLRNGKATFRISGLPIGRNAIEAVYSGTVQLTPSTSAVRIETVRPGRSPNTPAGPQGGAPS
jgi:hypothetical protein